MVKKDLLNQLYQVNYQFFGIFMTIFMGIYYIIYILESKNSYTHPDKPRTFLDENCLKNLTQQCISTNDIFYISPQDIEHIVHMRRNGRVFKFNETENIVGWDGTNPMFKEYMKMSYIKERLSVIYLVNNQRVKYSIPDEKFIYSLFAPPIIQSAISGNNTANCTVYDGLDMPIFRNNCLTYNELTTYSEIYTCIAFIIFLMIFFCSLEPENDGKKLS